jgi:MFS family permease
MKHLRFRATTVILAMLCLMYFITYLDRVNVSTAAAGFGKEFDLSKTEIGLVFSAFAYPYLVFQIIGGWVSDKFGAKRTLIVCGLLWAVATILTGFAGGLVSLLLCRLLLGFGEGATFPAATSAMSRWVPKDQRGFAQGITHAFARVGNAVAPAAVVWIMATHGWRESFYVCGAISLLWVAGWAWSFTGLVSLLPMLFTHDAYVAITSLSAGFFFAEMTTGPMWAIPMDIAPDYSGTASGMMNTGSALAAIICPVLSGYLIDRTGNWELPFIGSMILMGLGIVLAFRMQPESTFQGGDFPAGARVANTPA